MALGPDGRLEQAQGEDVHVAAGVEFEQALGTSFTMHGFRYLELSGDLFAAEDLALTVQPLALAGPPTAEFLSDHAGLNELYGRLAATLRATLPGFPAAGLEPDQRVPLLEEAGLRFRSALLTQPAPGLLGSWLSDVAEAQLPEGGWPAVVPAPPDLDPLLADGGAGVSDAPIEAAWLLFRLLGDRRALETLYPRIRRFLGGLQAQYPDHLRGEPPGGLKETVWYHRSARSAARVAGVLGYLAELEDCETLAASIRQAFRRRFVTPDGLLVGDDFDTYLAALNHGVLDAAERKTAIAEMLRRLESVESTASLGEALQPDALRTLTLLGRSDLALQMLLDAAGRTEATDGWLLDSGCLDWLLTSLAGMDLGRDLSAAHNAFRRMRIQPRPPLGGVVDPSTNVVPGPPLRVVEAALDTISGRYEVRWEITEVAFELSVVVPCNCAADVILPDETVHEVVAGRHSFTMPFNKAGDGIPILREVSGGG
jgi:alpha-L-rhamnosidase